MINKQRIKLLLTKFMTRNTQAQLVWFKTGENQSLHQAYHLVVAVIPWEIPSSKLYLGAHGS